MRATAHRTDLEAVASVLLDSIDQGIVVVDPEFRYLLFNHWMERMTGIPAEQALGRNCFELFPALRATGWDKYMMRALGGEQVQTPELPYDLPGSGRRTWFSSRCIPLRDEHGTVVAALAVNSMVSARGTDAARKSEGWYRSLTENSADMVSVLYADGSTKYLSPSLERFLGVPAGTSLASAFDAIHPDDIAMVREEFARCLEQCGEQLQAQFRYRRADGEWRTLVAVARNLLDDPIVRGIVVNSRDVTEQHDLELQLQHAQKLDAIGRMAGAVAHDFNNMLTVIQGNTGLALMEIPEGQPGRAELEEIGEAASRATALTRQLLMFSRQQSLEVQELSVNAVIEGLHRLLGRVVNEHHRLRLQLDPAAGRVRADRGQLEQVLMNLVSNARDAMPDGGDVTISTRKEELYPERARFHPGVAPGPFAVIAVADTGMGMDDAVRARIFEPFFTTKERGKGTGLGLPTVYGIVQRAGGFVVVESAPGQGTTFELFLPRAGS